LVASFVVVSCNVGATSILAYDSVMHTGPDHFPQLAFWYICWCHICSELCIAL